MNPKNIKRFSSLTQSYLLKVTKILVKNSQFELLVMAQEKLFCLLIFLSLTILDFSLFFCVKIATSLPLKKIPLSPPTSSKNSCQCPLKPPLPFFENLVEVGVQIMLDGLG